MVDNERATELDRRLVAAARRVKVLSSLTWGEEVVHAFLRGWRSGEPRLPEPAPVARSLSETVAELESVVREADSSDPLQRFVADTARSYALAARMLEASGSPEFTAISRELYGAPDDRLAGSGRTTHLGIAESLLENSDDLSEAGIVPDHQICLSAETVATSLEEAFGAFFGERAPRVRVDPDLASKAAAGSRRVRLRAGTCFSTLDIDQLREHEGFVHAATALNGRAQPVLSCMGLSAPRTTLTQEGIATFAEVITHSLDIARLRRLALRTVAIDRALSGADFLDVFRFFLEAGQSEDESARSAMRIFRGGDVGGTVAFTKDVVYLGGLISVHTFLRKAIAQGRPEVVRRLFAGRLSLPDVLSLESAFATGALEEPAFVPVWATDLHRLGAHLAFSAAMNRIDLGEVELEEILQK